MKAAILLLTASLLLVSMIAAETKVSYTPDNQYIIEETLVYDKKVGGKLVGKRTTDDGQDIALLVEKSSKLAVWTEKVGLSRYFNQIYGIFWSPDNNHLAIVASDYEYQMVVLVDGEQVGVYRGVWDNQVLFSKDSRHYAFLLISRRS